MFKKNIYCNYLELHLSMVSEKKINLNEQLEIKYLLHLIKFEYHVIVY